MILKMKNLTKTFNLLLTLIGTLFLFTVAAQASIFTVSNTNDSGFGSLRKAIDDANSNPGADVIHFSIGGGGVHTIVPLTSLPPLNDTVDLDGYSQPGTKANTLALGDDAVLLIEINGAAISANTPVILFVNAPNCTIRGLVINRSAEYGIYLASAGSGSTISGNFIGTDADGLFAQPNGREGIHFDNSSSNVIGGTVPAARNVISGNTYPNQSGGGVFLRGLGSSKNKIQGNFIGTNRFGNGAINNHQAGVYMDTQASNNTIGGTTAGARNIISGNATVGVGTYGAGGNLIEGNFIGTDATGTFSVANPVGVAIASDGFFNQIGDAVPGAGNLISGNTFYGIDINGNQGQNPYVTQVLGNFIGTNAAGTGPLGNGREGVRIQSGAFNNIIGTSAPGGANVIAFNGTDPSQGGSGVHVVSDAGNGNLISGNSIYSNKTLGIDLDGQTSGVTPNDALDGDDGPNDLQNFPVISNATYSVINGTQIGYSLSSKANTKYTIEIFASDTCNASGYGEGQQLINTFTFSANGNGDVFAGLGSSISYLNKYITATATDPNGSTSEFSKCMKVTTEQFGNLSFSAANYNVNENGGTATITVQRTGGSSSAVSVNYATGAGGTANSGSDYVAASGTLNWAPGDNFDKTFTIPITDDAVNEPNETAMLTLSNPAGGATLGIQSTATLTITDNDSQPSLSISDVSLAEGNSGATNFNFNVTLSAASAQTVTVNYATGAGGTATQGNDYQPTSGTLTFAPGETSKPITVLVNSDLQVEPDETFMVQLSGPGNATTSKTLGTGTIINDDAVTPATVQFSAATYLVQEDLTAVQITVIRSGDTAGTTTVDYATADGTALQHSDYELASGTLTFAPGETSQTFKVLINEDSYVEGTETVNLVLNNPTGSSLGVQSSAQLSIDDDAIETTASPIDDPQSFVHMQYHDFLNREPDPAGLQFWTNEITSCGQDAACIAGKRTNVSGAFFLSIEFQQTGYLLYLLQKESFASLPRYNSFMRDLQEVSQGVVVNAPGWEQKIAVNQQQLAREWVERPAFKAAYDSLSNTSYVNALYTNAGVVPATAEQSKLVSKLDTASESRAEVLLDVAANTAFHKQEQSSAFVLMEYFGYLRRDPDSGPDSDFSGYYFWLQKLNAFNGDYQQAEMVRAFTISSEYRARFGQQ